jgi:Domain of unknown function (DUF4337)
VEVEVSAEAKDKRLNRLVAITVVVLSVFMGLCNIKDGNIVQAMSQQQAKAVDQWSYYQAKGMKQNLAESVVDQLILQKEMGASLAPAAKELLDKKLALYASQVKKYEKEKEDIKKEAEGAQAEYDRLNIHDDQFDLSEAGLSIAIAVLGVSALTKKRWLVVFALVFALFGIVLGLAGFLGWSLHPDALARVLS